MGQIIDLVTNPNTTHIFGVSFSTFAVGLAGVFLLGAAANTGRVVMFRIAGERIVQRLRNNLYTSILHQDISFFDRERCVRALVIASVCTAASTCIRMDGSHASTHGSM